MRNTLLSFSILLILTSFNLSSFSQNQKLNFFDPSPTYDQQRMKIIGVTAGAMYVSSMFGLYELWYKNYPQSSFHFFDDNGEWLQMDKGGHCVVAYYLGSLGIDVLNWAGVKKNQATWYGGLVGAAYNTTFECLDGLSSEYGFSIGDMTANFAGAFICIGEQLAWGQQRIQLKFSYHHSPEADLRPDLLGNDFPSNAIKDYNGLSDWVSINMYDFMNRSSAVPRWLNVAFGYGADGMLGARMNPVSYNGNDLPNLDRHRQYYFSLDVDLSQINTKSKAVNTAFDLLNLIKVMFPSLEYNRVTKFLFHPFYF
jgi:hypothetical protein